MKVELKLFFDFSKFLPGGSKLDIQRGSTIQAVVKRLGLPERIPKTILVNGRKADEQTLLEENDSIAIFPPMAGG